ncbi:MAG: glycosyltransferase family 4 protein [Actinomycetota bacterium]
MNPHQQPARIRVLVVIDSLGGGGAERSTALVLTRLARFGVDATAVVLRRTIDGDEDMVRASGVAIEAVASTTLVGRVRAIRRLIKSTRPDVVHTSIFDSDIAGRIAAAGTGVPVVSTLINTQYDPSRYVDPAIPSHKLRLAQTIDALSARFLTVRLHAVSAGVKTANITALGLPPNKIEVIDRGRDLERFRNVTPDESDAVRQSLGIPLEAPVVLSVGRLAAQKAPADLVLAHARLSDRLGAPWLVFAGPSGNASERVARAIEQLRPEQRVRVLVLGPRRDIPTLLHAADAFAMASHYEGTAGAAIEALAAGTPVVATNVAGVAGVLEHDQNARLVAPARPDLLAEALGDVLVDDSLRARLIRGGLETTSARFDLDEAAREMADFYRRAVTRG